MVAELCHFVFLWRMKGGGFSFLVSKINSNWFCLKISCPVSMWKNDLPPLEYFLLF